MPVTNPSAIVDAISADLAATSGLHPAKVVLYAEPKIVMPESTPLLAIWCEATDYELLTAGAGEIAYERVHTVVVAWNVADLLAAETGGTGDPTVVHDLDATAETLVAHLAGYAAGVPGFGSQLVATLRTRRLQPLEGVIWSARIELRVEEAS
jgi:hypothetical protein